MTSETYKEYSNNYCHHLWHKGFAAERELLQKYFGVQLHNKKDVK